MFRRSILLATLAVCVLAVTGLSATQSVDDLIARNLEAKGGVAKLKSVLTIKQVATAKMQGMEASITVLSKRPNRVRQELNVSGQKVINAFDGVTPWIVNPMVSPRPMAISGPQADMLREQGDFDGPLVDYKAKDYKAELVGQESLGDVKVFHIRLVGPSRQVIHLYLDAVTSLEVKRMTEVENLKLEQELSDYRTVDGMKVPFRIRMLTNGVPQSEFLVQSVEFNLPMDDAIFRMPKG